VCRRTSRPSAPRSSSWRSCRSWGTSGAPAYFWAIELVADKETRTTFTAEQSEWLLRGFLSHRMYDAGLICRADDRGDPVIQLSPPLIAGQPEFDRIVSILGEVLLEAQQQMLANSAAAF